MARHAQAPLAVSSEAVGERVVAGHTAYAVVELQREASMSPRTVNVVGHLRCLRSVGGVSVTVPTALDSLVLRCSANEPVWAHAVGIEPPADRSLLRATGWEAEVVTPAGGLARTVEYAFTTTVPMPDGSLVETESLIWETTTRIPEADASGVPYNFQFALNADGLARLGVRSLDVTLAPE